MAGDRGQATSRIFICYRHDDTRVEAILVRDRLIRDLGEIVDMDVEIPAGVEWRRWIEERLEVCDVAIVLIGKAWLTLASEGGHPLGDPEDQLTHEIRTALEREDVSVIPVLVQDAPRPGLSKLPSALHELDRIQEFRVLLSDWDRSGQRLVEEVKPHLGLAPGRRDPVPPDPVPPTQDPPAPDPPRPPPPPSRVRWGFIAAASVAVLAVGSAAGWLITQGDGDGSDPIVVSPGSITFGDQQVGTKSGSWPVEVVNDSSDTVLIQAFDIAPAGDFQREDRECVDANPLPPSSRCTVRVTFTPGEGGPRDARLIVLPKGSARALYVTLRGSGTAAATPEPEPVVTMGTAAATTIAPTDTEWSTLTEGPPATAPQ